MVLRGAFKASAGCLLRIALAARALGNTKALAAERALAAARRTIRAARPLRAARLCAAPQPPRLIRQGACVSAKIRAWRKHCFCACDARMQDWRALVTQGLSEKNEKAAL
ncbi:MAG: hypothetical protein LBP52_06610 [Burkholderiaceae bacterium]|jgi:hypothetical protein|nr:hypothetical protein [Burkholderiaceae bacterium]